MKNVIFEDWLPYENLPARIHHADILLGVFGTTPKAGRVIPNKVYQSLACGRAVITRHANVYPEPMCHANDTGLVWCDAGDAKSLAEQVAMLASDSERLNRLGSAASETSRQYFSENAIREQLKSVLA